MGRLSDREPRRDRKHASLDGHEANNGNTILCLGDAHSIPNLGART